MALLVEKAAAHIRQLEADRLAAIAASEEKAWEAKLIEARLEGFRQATELLGVEPFSVATDQRPNKRQGGKRRNIPELILTELSFSGAIMTTNQIAEAIDYIPELTEKALKRLESSGQVKREKDGRWSALAMPPHCDGAATVNGTFSVKNGQYKE
jgi:DNA-binding LacI/PurR family transcriptional regulator